MYRVFYEKDFLTIIEKRTARASSVDSIMDKEFTIRVTGGPPPPIPGAKFHASLPGFLFGWVPPKELDQGGKRTVHELGVRANESVIVKFTLNESATAGNESTTAVATASAKQSASSSTSDSPSSFTNGRKKRAAATAAAASFPELIAAQDAMMKTEQKKKSSTVKSFGGATKRIVATSSSSSQGQEAKIEGTGYRLSDGKAVEGAVSKRKGSSKQQPMFKSEDDIAGNFYLQWEGGGGNTGKFLRTAMKGAVEKSYEESRAAVRVAAVNLEHLVLRKNTSSPLTAQEDAFIDDWKLVTPSEDDIDELVECITEAKESDSYDDKDAKAWAADLVDNVRNWRGLANADSDVVLAQLNNQNIQAETYELPPTT
ncbi:hypothetical protein QTG54_005367, partial [Skeletonema marinoi]